VILALARSSHRDLRKLNREALALSPRLECQPARGFGQPAGRGGLMHNDWLTDLSVIGMSGSPSCYPEVKPDNNDAERACVP